MVWGVKHVTDTGEKVYTTGSVVRLLRCRNAPEVGNGDNEGQ